MRQPHRTTMTLSGGIKLNLVNQHTHKLNSRKWTWAYGWHVARTITEWYALMRYTAGCLPTQFWMVWCSFVRRLTRVCVPEIEFVFSLNEQCDVDVIVPNALCKYEGKVGATLHFSNTAFPKINRYICISIYFLNEYHSMYTTYTRSLLHLSSNKRL